MNDAIKQHLSGLEKQSPAQAPGLSRVQNALTNAVKCMECGSEWFFVVQANKYANMYSATPGGDLHELSTPQSVRICVCGAPFNPNIGGVKGGRTPNNILNDFLGTLAQAKQTRAFLAEQVASVAAAAAPLDEYLALKERVDLLEQALATKSDTSETVSKDAAEPAAKKMGRPKKQSEPESSNG